MNIELIIQYIFSGLTYGSIYAIVAIGFNIIYNSTGIINFAQGEFVMLGSMMAYSFSQFMPLIFAIILAVLITSIIGSIIELLFIRSLIKFSIIHINTILTGLIILICSILLKNSNVSKIFQIFIIISLIIFVLLITNLLLIFTNLKNMLQKLKKPTVLQMIVVTIGLSIIIREIALHIWGEQVKTIPYFTGNEISSISIFGANFSPQILWIIGITGFIVSGLTLFFKFTLTGQAMRACSANREGASLCGINPQLIINLSFMLSACIGAIAGCAVAPMTQTHYAIGSELAIKGFTVSIVGGLGNSMAAVIAGMLLGIIEAFTVSIFPEAYKEIITICILLLILFIKPSGLFGSREVSRLKEF